MKKLLALLAVFALALTGCTTTDGGTTEPEANEDTTGETGGETSSFDGQTIQVGVDGGYVEYFTQIAEDFEAANPGVTVEIIETGMFDILDNLETQKGNSADVFMMPNDRIGDLSDKKLILPITTDISAYTEKAQQAVTYNDEHYTVPLSVETTLFFYNKALTDTVPATLQEIDPNIWAGKFTDFYFTAGFFASNGGYIFGETTEDIGLNNEGSIKTGEAIQSLYDTQINHWEALKEEAAGYEQGVTNFMDGELTYWVDGPWKVAEFLEAGVDLGYAPIPSWDGTADYQPLSGTKGLGVNAYSAELEASLAFIDFVATAEYAQLYHDITSEVNPHTSISYEDGSLAATVLAAVDASTPMPTDSAFQKFWGPMADALKQIVVGADPKEALDAAVDIIKTDIAAMN